MGKSLRHSHVSGRNMIAFILLESKFKFKICLSFDPEISSLGIYYKEIRNLYKYTSRTFTVEFFNRKEGKNWKQPKFLTIGTWLKIHYSMVLIK